MSLLHIEKHRQNAQKFMLEWASERDEKGEAHSFWDAFFRVFDLERRHFAKHESRVARVGKSKGFIDLFWPGKLLVEHKSWHKNTEKDWNETLEQAFDYIADLKKELRPQVVVLCNFRQFRIIDLEQNPIPERDFSEISTPTNSPSLWAEKLAQGNDEFKDFGPRRAAYGGFEAIKHVKINVSDLPQKIEAFQFIPRFAETIYKEEEKVNLAAIDRVVNIKNSFRSFKYSGRDLELLLMRVLFCAFAEDTGIFEDKQFTDFIDHDTLDSGIGESLVELFQTLNTPVRLRDDSIKKSSLGKFPYVNGGLFQDELSVPPPSIMGVRNTIRTCTDQFDWGQISPEIFGSLFQAVLSDAERRSLGAHFTSEKNIRRLIDPLFMRDLWQAWADAGDDAAKLTALLGRIAEFHFLDPACGCGNFLVVVYREMRILEIEILKKLVPDPENWGELRKLRKVRLAQMHGIEINASSAMIAQTALWLTDHQCNQMFNDAFHLAIPRIPLSNEAQILAANALQTDWPSLLPKGETFDFVIGNPPFIGKHLRTAEQTADMEVLFKGVDGWGDLDFVTSWHLKSAKLIQKTTAKVGFVSTNSIAQGEQVGALWKTLFDDLGIKIHFAHQTFKWQNEAPGVAAVHCIIIGFAAFDSKSKSLFEYEKIDGEPIESKPKNISPYLIEGGDVFVKARQNPLSDVPKMVYGSKPVDGGNLIFETDEKAAFLKMEPKAAPFFRPFIGADEYINGKIRHCLWLENASLEELEKLPEVKKRVDAVQKMRLASPKISTQKWAAQPHLFIENRQSKSDYVIVPSVSSERRSYVPIGFLEAEIVVSNLAFLVPNASLFLFGVLTSEMHMAWMRYVCGRLKSDYRYSNTIVYNNFPFPDTAEKSEKSEVEKAAQAILDIRKTHAPKSLAQLYDPLKMPADLLAAHQKLDRAVDAAYGLTKPFLNETRRVAWLFERYEGLMNR